MRKKILTELGLEILCCKCNEYWPASIEFFYRKGGGWHSYCKACYSERLKELRNGAARCREVRVEKMTKRGLT